MFCPQCGNQNEDSAVFCGKCGAKIRNTAAQDLAVNTNNMIADTVTASHISDKSSDNPILTTVKKVALSPYCILTAVAFSLMIFFYIYNYNFISESIMESVRDAFDEIGLLTIDLKDILSMSDGFAKIGAFITMLPNIVIAIGIWMTIYFTFDIRKGSMSISGLDLIRIVVSVMFVLNIIYAVLYVVLSGIFCYHLIKEEIPLPIIAFIIMLAALAAMIFRVYCLNKMKELIDSMRYVIYNKKIHVPSLFVAIISFISCVGYVFSALLTDAVSDWLGAAAFLGFGLLICKYRAEMQELQNHAKTFADE